MKKSLRLLMGLLLATVCSMSLNAATVTDELTNALTGVSGNNYTEWSDKTATSKAVYAGQSAGGNSSIQLRSNNNNSGVVTTTSGGKAKKVTVTWNSNTANGRTLNVYGNSTAYSAATDLYNTNSGTLIGTIVCGTSTTLNITDDYEYIGFRSASGAMYLDNVAIEWEVESGDDDEPDTPVDPTVNFADESLEIEVGETAINVLSYPSDLSVTFSSSNSDVATVDAATGEVTGVAVGEVTITASWDAVENTYNAGSVDYILTVTEATAKPTYVKVTGIDALTSSDVFIIVGTTSGGTYAMSNDNGTGSAPLAVEVTVSDDKIVTDATNILWTITKNTGETTTYTFKPKGDTENALYCTSNNNNGVRVGTNDNNNFTITDDYLYNVPTTRYIGIYNNAEWRCYTSINANIRNESFAFYKLDSDAPADEREEAGLSFAIGSYEVEVGASPFTNELTNPHDLAVTYSSTNNEVATVDASGLVTIEGIGTATIKAEFAGDDNYFSGSATYTVTVTSAPYSNIAELQAAVTSTSTPIKVIFTDVQVTAVKGSQAYICDTDGNGALIYQSGHGLSAGQILNGTLSCNLLLYRGQTEITNFSTDGLIVTEGELVPTTMTVGEITAANQSRYVSLNKVRYESGLLYSDGGSSITFYDTFNTNATLEDGNYYNIDGIVILYNETLEFAPLTADAISPYTEDVSISFLQDNVSLYVGETFQTEVEVVPETLSYTYSSDDETIALVNEETGLVHAANEGSATITLTWEDQVIDGVTYPGGSISYSLVAEYQEAGAEVSFDESTIFMYVGDSQNSPMHINPSGLDVTVASSDPDGLDVENEDGTVFFTANEEGIYTINVTWDDQIIDNVRYLSGGATLEVRAEYLEFEAEVEFAENEVEIYVGESHTTPLTISPDGLAVIVTSSNPTYLYLDDEDGVAFTGNSAGSYVIDATWEEQIIGNVRYPGGSVQLNVMVNDYQEGEVDVHFAEDHVSMTVMEEYRNNLYKSPADLVVSVTSSAPDYLNIDDEYEIDFTAYAVGEFTVTASWDEQVIDNVRYAAGSTSFTVEVSDFAPTELVIDEDDDYEYDSNYYEIVSLHRTLKANNINTFVVPFDISVDEAKEAFGEDITIYELTGLKTNQGGTSLSFENVTSEGIRANVPCLINNAVPSSDNWYVFEDRGISDELPEVRFESIDGVGVAFIGAYQETEIPADDANYVISNSKIYVVNKAVTMKPTRAYIYAPAANGAKVIGIDFNDGTTGIMDVANGSVVSGNVYDLSGRAVKTPSRGMYIINGKKVLY